jgi:hypothetical protein
MRWKIGLLLLGLALVVARFGGRMMVRAVRS